MSEEGGGLGRLRSQEYARAAHWDNADCRPLWSDGSQSGCQEPPLRHPYAKNLTSCCVEQSTSKCSEGMISTWHKAYLNALRLAGLMREIGGFGIVYRWIRLPRKACLLLRYICFQHTGCRLVSTYFKRCACGQRQAFECDCGFVES